MDIPAVLVAQSHVRFAAASELFRIPLLRGAMRALGTIAVDRDVPARARRQLAAATTGDPYRLVVFAEGGIGDDETPLAFKTGPFALAIEARAAIVPVAITGARGILPSGVRLAARPGTVWVRRSSHWPLLGSACETARHCATEPSRPSATR